MCWHFPEHRKPCAFSDHPSVWKVYKKCLIFPYNCVCIVKPDTLLLRWNRWMLHCVLFLYNFPTKICTHFFSMETTATHLKLVLNSCSNNFFGIRPRRSKDQSSFKFQPDTHLRYSYLTANAVIANLYLRSLTQGDAHCRQLAAAWLATVC